MKTSLPAINEISLWTRDYFQKQYLISHKIENSKHVEENHEGLLLLTAKSGESKQKWFKEFFSTVGSFYLIIKKTFKNETTN